RRVVVANRGRMADLPNPAQAKTVNNFRKRPEGARRPCRTGQVAARRARQRHGWTAPEPSYSHVGTDVRGAVLLQHEVGGSVVQNLLNTVAESLPPHDFR